MAGGFHGNATTQRVRSEGVDQFLEVTAAARGTEVSAVESDFFQERASVITHQGFATTAEVGAMVAYIRGGRASATNGAALPVVGGAVRSIL